MKKQLLNECSDYFMLLIIIAGLSFIIYSCSGGKGDSGIGTLKTPIPVPDINPMNFTDNGNGTINDNVTGLMWQKEDDNTPRTWDEAVAYCSDLALGGHSDWRLPEEFELITIVDYGQNFYPAINTTSFPGTNTAEYWSATISRLQANSAWYVDFIVGITGANSKSNINYVRCIRGNAYQSKSFTDNSNGTVTDNTTGLIWQKAYGGRMKWESAITYCESLNLASFTDWRLPNIKELSSIIDWSRLSPALDTNYFIFDYSSPTEYWSSTGQGDRAWIVLFDTGGVWDGYFISYDGNVRCVRGGVH